MGDQQQDLPDQRRVFLGASPTQAPAALPATFELWSFPASVHLRVLLADGPRMLTAPEEDFKHLRNLLLTRFPLE